MAWISASPGRLKFRHWGAEHLVFNPVTGHTHLLTEFGGLVLTALDHSSTALTSEQLLAQMLDEEFFDDQELQTLSETLRAFVVLGLVESTAD